MRRRLALFFAFGEGTPIPPDGEYARTNRVGSCPGDYTSRTTLALVSPAVETLAICVPVTLPEMSSREFGVENAVSAVVHATIAYSQT